MSVPLQNVYYLLCYAWNRLEVRDQISLGSVSGERVENLLGVVLDAGLADLIRRGLDRGYVDVEEEGRRLRGKLLLSQTVRRMLVQRGQVACLTDELSYDVPHNRVLKAAARALINLPTLDGKVRSRLRGHVLKLDSVTDVELSPSAFRQVQLHRNVSRYVFLVNIAQLVARSLLPDQTTGHLRFHPFTANEQAMGTLFQLFVRHFLEREQDQFRVSAPKIQWDLETSDTSDKSWLPEMRTDVLLESSSQRVLLETKYYAQPYQEQYSRKTLISDHLYQLLSYLTQMSVDGGPKPVGVLLYADTGEGFDLTYRVSGHVMRVKSLNLNQSWPDIHRSLLTLAQDVAHQPELAPA